MAVGSAVLPTLHPVAGFKLGIGSAGIKKPGRRDLVVMELIEGANVAGVFTTNAFCAAPVHLSKAHLAEGKVKYLMINTGNANAGTGKQGMLDAKRCCQALADLTSVSINSVLPYSTGVIGEPLPVEKIITALPMALADLSENNWLSAANGIMTTDTRPKAASIKIMLDGKAVTLTGISKGAGMIRPNMATMLGFIATDADIPVELLQSLLKSSADQSFNRITIDSDTSTNDSCMLIATGASGVKVDQQNPKVLERFTSVLNQLMRELAHAIVRDGEGATKFVTVTVESAADQEEALKVAYDIAHSPLVKTALFASDPNWGRILAVVGRAGVKELDLDALKIYLGETCIVEKGGRAASYTEEQGQEEMQQEEITIRVVLNRGKVCETVWTTDLSQEYVSINADYRS